MRQFVAPLWIALLAAGCGATGETGGGAAGLPVSGAGPFRSIDPDPSVLSDVLADLDDPVVVRRGDALAVWVTSERNGAPAAIEHADAYSLDMKFGPLIAAVSADQNWEQGAVRAPAVLEGPPWMLFYQAGGAIGWATAADGHTWQKGPGPTLDGAEEGTALGSPAAVRLGDRVRLYYTAGGQVWAAEASFVSLAGRLPTAWTRLDGDPSTPARDPMIAGAPFLVGIDRVTARAAPTPAGRLRHDLYFSGRTGIMTTPTGCGFAASYSGDAYAVASTPILPLSPAARGPTMTPYGDGALLLYIAESGVRDGVAAALSP